MIYLYCGTPGSGKSLDMARSILNDLRFNKPVICNFPIVAPKRKEKLFNFWANENLSPSRLVVFSDEYFKSHIFHEGAITLYIDECQLLFNARTWNIKGRSDWNAFFTNHRHFGYDIVLVAQFDGMIDKQIRSLIEVKVIHRKLNNMGLKGLFFRVLMLSPTLFIKIHYYYPTNDKLSSGFFRYHRKYSKIYDSYSSVFIKDTYSELLDNDNSVATSGAIEERKKCQRKRQQVSFYNYFCNSILNKVALIALLFLSKL